MAASAFAAAIDNLIKPAFESYQETLRQSNRQSVCRYGANQALLKILDGGALTINYDEDRRLIRTLHERAGGCCGQSEVIEVIASDRLTPEKIRNWLSELY